MAKWDFTNGTTTFGNIDFTQPPEVIADILGLDKAGTEKLVSCASEATDPANREKLLRKIINTAISIGAKAASGGISIGSILV